MLKKRIFSILSVLTLLLILTIIIYSIVNIRLNKKAEDLSSNFTLELSKLFTDINTDLSNFKLSDVAVLKLKNYKEYLLLKNENYVILPDKDIDESGATAPPELDENGNVVEVVGSGDVENLKTDSNVYEENGERRIKIKDLDFSNGKYALIDLDGGSYKILLSEIDMTYDMLKSNPNYFDFELFLITKVDKNIYDVVLKSKLSDIVFKSRVQLKGNTIEDFTAK